MFFKGYLTYILPSKLISYIYALYLIARFGIKGARNEIDRQNRILDWMKRGGKYKGL